MAGQGLRQEGIARLLGREPECAAIDRLLDDARAGLAPSTQSDRLLICAAVLGLLAAAAVLAAGGCSPSSASPPAPS